MGWMIGRTAALSNPQEARRKAVEKLRSLAELEDPEVWSSRFCWMRC